MNRQLRNIWAVLLTGFTAGLGCHPLQPRFFYEDGDLSHYIDVATDVEYPDVEHTPLDEVTGAFEPVTIHNIEMAEKFCITLEETIRHALANSQVIRATGARVVRPDGFTPLSEKSSTALSRLVGGQGIFTSYDPALVESSYGVSSGAPESSGQGVEAALAEFDARVDGSLTFDKVDQPQNVQPGNAIQPLVLQQDLGRFNLGVTKTTAAGGTFSFQNNTLYEATNSPLRALNNTWTTNFEGSFTQPLLQGRGAQYNRIAGPQSFAQFQQGSVNQFDGVIIARIRHDIELAEFECSLIELVQEVETVYWDLYYAYRELDANQRGMQAARRHWDQSRGRGGREGEEDPQGSERAKAEYFRFQADVEASVTDLIGVENRLRYLMGLAVADGRLLCPTDEPTTALVKFDWCLIHPEAVTRRCEVRKQKWEIKKREMELIASKNHLMPRLDAVGRYRWLGLGDDLIDTDRSGLTPIQRGSNAFESLTGGDFQEWQLGVQLSMPLGYRRELAGVRHQQLLLTRERAILDDLELEISHQVGEAVRMLASAYKLTTSNLSRRVAAENEVLQARNRVQNPLPNQDVTGLLDQLLDSERRLVDAEIQYYRSLADYSLAVMRVHYRKGSLLEYDNVLMAEGPWPKKAYFDALRDARYRDAAHFINYGYTRPKVLSQGPVPQHTLDVSLGGVPTLAPAPGDAPHYEYEEVEPPQPDDQDMPDDFEYPEPSFDTSTRAPVARPMPARASGPVLRGPQLTSASGEPAMLELHPPTAPATSRAAPTTPRRVAHGVRARQLSYEEFSRNQSQHSAPVASARARNATSSGWQSVNR